MTLRLLISALIASTVLALPADAATKKKARKTTHHHHAGAVYTGPGMASASQSVYVGGEYIGRDPDPSIRAYMMSHPHDWDGPE